MNCDTLTLESAPALLENAVAQYRAASCFAYRAQHRLVKGGHGLEIGEHAYFLREGGLSFQTLTLPKAMAPATQTTTIKLSFCPEYVLTMPRTDPPLLLRFETGSQQQNTKDAGGRNAGVARLDRAMAEIANHSEAFDFATADGLITLTRRPGAQEEGQGPTFSERIVIDSVRGFPVAIEESTPSMQLTCKTSYSDWDTCADTIRKAIEDENAILLHYEIQDVDQSKHDVQQIMNSLFAF